MTPENKQPNDDQQPKKTKHVWFSKQKKPPTNNDLDSPQAGTKALSRPKNLKSWQKQLIGWSILGAIILAVVLSLLLTHNETALKTIFITVFISNFLAIPALLIGFITFIGNLLQKISIQKNIVSTLKAALGFLMLEVGATFLAGVAAPVLYWFGQAVGISSAYLNAYTAWTNSQTILNDVGDAAIVIQAAVLVALIVNITWVACKKYTNCHSVMVTGHVMFQQSSVVSMVMYFVVFRNVGHGTTEKEILSFIFAGLVLGTYWSTMTNLDIKAVTSLTKKPSFTIGHQQMLGSWIAYNAGGVLHGKKTAPLKKADDIKLSKNWKFFEDSLVSSSILLFIFFEAILIAVAATNIGDFHKIFIGIDARGSEAHTIGFFNFLSDASDVLKAILLPLTVVVCIQIIIRGARMFVSELQKSFIGISKRLLPGAIVAVDIAASFAFAKNAIVLGFLSGAIGSFIAMGIIIGLATAKVLPSNIFILVGFIPMFFDNAAFGVFANEKGGLKATLVVPFCLAIISVFGALLAVELGGTYSFEGKTYSIWNNEGFYSYLGSFDANTIWAVFSGLATILGKVGAPTAIAIYILLFALVAQLTDTGLRKTKMPLRVFCEKQFLKIKAPFSKHKPMLNDIQQK